MAQSTIASDLTVQGTLVPTRLVIPAAAVNDNSVQAAAGVQATKLEHQYQPIRAQAAASASTSDRGVIHIVQGATADLVDFTVGHIVVPTGATLANFPSYTVDLLKNGSSVLSSAVAVATAGAYVKTTGTISSSTAVVGDVFEVNTVMTVPTGTAAKGVFARLTIREDA